MSDTTLPPDDGAAGIEADRDPGGDGAVVPRLRHVRHRGAGAARRPRRSQAGAPPHPLGHVRHQRAARPVAREVRHRRRRGDGQVPPPRRQRHLRRPGAPRPAVLAAPPAHRPARQLRLAHPIRRRRCATPSAGCRSWRCTCSPASTRTPSTSRTTSTLPPGAEPASGPVPQPARQRRPGHRGGHGHQHPASQPGRGGRCRHAPPVEPRGRQRRAHELRQGPRLPHRWADPRAQGIYDAYTTGRGSIKVRAKAEIVEDGKNTSIVVTEIPYQTSVEAIEEKAAELVDKREIEGIRTIRNESAKGNTRLVFELKKDAPALVILNQLYKGTPAAEHLLGQHGGARRRRPPDDDPARHPRGVDRHQVEVVTRRSEFRLAKAQAREHIVEGLVKAVGMIDDDHRG